MKRQLGDLPHWLGVLIMVSLFVATAYVEHTMPDPTLVVQP